MMDPTPSSILLHYDDGRTVRKPLTVLDRVLLVDGGVVRAFKRVQRTSHYVEVPFVPGDTTAALPIEGAG